MQGGIILALILLSIGNVLAWFQGNLQFISDWWYNRPLLTIMLFATPTATCFYFGWRFLVEYLNDSLWSARLFSFGIGVILFAFLSYFMKGETIDKKTGICILLSLIIVFIQTFYKDDGPTSIEVNQVEEIE